MMRCYHRTSLSPTARHCSLAMIPFLFMVQTQLVIQADQLYVLFELADLPGGVHLSHDRLSRRFGRGCEALHLIELRSARCLQ